MIPDDRRTPAVALGGRESSDENIEGKNPSIISQKNIPLSGVLFLSQKYSSAFTRLRMHCSSRKF